MTIEPNDGRAARTGKPVQISLNWWHGSVHCMLRTTAKRSAIRAWRGISSHIGMPGTFEGMGRNSPRYSAGASGLMSYMSMWLGPPPRQIMMTDLRGAAGRLPGRGLQAQQVRQGEPARGEAADAEEVAPRQAVAEPALLAAVDREHCEILFVPR